jgi:hypothetical protein
MLNLPVEYGNNPISSPNVFASLCYSKLEVIFSDHVKYLGLHLDRKLTWHQHIFTKRKQLELTLTKMYWLLGHSSRLSLPNKLPCKTILNPIWTYGIQLGGTASTSNIEILERFQSKALRIIVDAPWYVPNSHIRRDLQLTSVKEKIRLYSSQYSPRLMEPH